MGLRLQMWLRDVVNQHPVPNMNALVGCTGTTGEFSMFGGVQNDGNVCRAQRNNVNGNMMVGAVCASQPSDGHQLKCEAVYSMTAHTDRRRLQFDGPTTSTTTKSALESDISDTATPTGAGQTPSYY